MKASYLSFLFFFSSIAFGQANTSLSGSKIINTPSTPNQLEAVSVVKNFGLIGAWGYNCKDTDSLRTFAVENNKLVLRYANPDPKDDFVIVEKAKLLNENQLHISTQIYNVSNDPFAKNSIVFFKNNGKLLIAFYEVTTKDKTEVQIRDGIILSNKEKVGYQNKCY